MTRDRASQKKVLQAAGILIFLVSVVYLVQIIRGVSRMTQVTISHSYAAWMTGDLLVEYLDTHHGKWPRSWANQ